MKNLDFSICYGYSNLLLHNALTNWSTLFVNVNGMTQVRILVLSYDKTENYRSKVITDKTLGL